MFSSMHNTGSIYVFMNFGLLRRHCNNKQGCLRTEVLEDVLHFLMWNGLNKGFVQPTTSFFLHILALPGNKVENC